MGKIAESLLKEGVCLGVSSRGIGSLRPTKEGYSEVGEDFMLATAADIVADPSAPDAFVQGIMEGKSGFGMVVFFVKNLQNKLKRESIH
jgi:hypothetical protein